MPELQGDVVWRQAEAERPAVDVERRHRRVARLVDASGDGLRVGGQYARRQGNVAKAGRHEDVGASTALEQPTTDLRPFGERVLRGCGLMVDTAHIHVGAAI